MSVKRIRLLGDPVLRTKCRVVRNCSSASTRKIVRDLRDTLADFRSRHRFGRGIAAPQIGAKVRIIYIQLDKLGPLINPRITKRSERKSALWDDCFSFPDILVRVKRNRRIEVSYQDGAGARKKLRATGGLSELLQHEIDHLNGVLAIDRAISTKHVILRSQLRT